MLDCQACDGRGFLTCIYCHGHGYIENKKTKKRDACVHCDATGRIICSECNGEQDLCKKRWITVK